MSDETIRELERAWKESRSFEDWKVWARALARSGETRPFRLLRTAERVVSLDRRLDRFFEMEDREQRDPDGVRRRIRTNHRARLFLRARRLMTACLDLSWAPPVERVLADRSTLMLRSSDGSMTLVAPLAGTAVEQALSQIEGAVTVKRKRRP